jgi:hypothetical protein
MKHKVFFWLLLKDLPSTRELLRRKKWTLILTPVTYVLERRWKQWLTSF